MGRSVSVVLITFNGARTLPRCLEGVRGQRGIPIDVTVIDNASADRSVELCRNALPEARFIENGKNLGFAAAANQGIEASKGDFVLLVNPDAFLEPDYAATLVREIESSGIDFGSATGLLLRAVGDDLSPTTTIDSMGIRMTRSGRHFDDGAGQQWIDRPISNHEVFGVSAAAALYRRSFLTDVVIDGKAFDEDFFVYREDADLAWRGRIFGWKSIFVPSAIAYHQRRVTPEVRSTLPASINMHSVKNRFLLRLNNEGRHLALRNAPFEFSRDLLVLGASLTIERTSLPAIVWLVRNRKRILERRKKIQSRRRVNDQQLAHWFG